MLWEAHSTGWRWILSEAAWNKLGIARYVTWPRTVCSIEGHDINGQPLKGNYYGSDLPMADGFKANAAFFKLGFLDKNAVALGRQFKERLPTLWMKAGAMWTKDTAGNYTVEVYKREIKAAEGNNLAEYQYRVMNVSEAERKVILRKVVDQTKPKSYEALPAARFRIFRADITEFTDGQEQGKNYYESLSNCVYFIGKLPYGKYYLVETQAPTDYSTNNTGKVFILTVNAEGVADPEAKDTINVSVPDEVQENLKAWVALHPTA
ncbi:MAG: hypothetical protein II885_13910 [Oscillospiraceae bacterium]|nr:hypothetical protein [Oscillospiraceae bacterium]